MAWSEQRLKDRYGSYMEAFERYQEAIDSGDHHDALVGMFKMGVLDLRFGNHGAARQAFLWVKRGDEPFYSAQAAFNLGALEQEVGNVAEARQAYRDAVSSGYYEVGPMAAYNLGILEAGEGDGDMARMAFELAAQSGHPTVADKARRRLRDMDEARREAGGA
ncbi:MAG: hypothetical protein Q3979_02675 [Actinomycetaceae bacterium]|nr:hypothetical protein [Actinomycetaceae bacterium]